MHHWQASSTADWRGAGRLKGLIALGSRLNKLLDVFALILPGTCKANQPDLITQLCKLSNIFEYLLTFIVWPNAMFDLLGRVADVVVDQSKHLKSCGCQGGCSSSRVSDPCHSKQVRLC